MPTTAINRALRRLARHLAAPPSMGVLGALVVLIASHAAASADAAAAAAATVSTCDQTTLRAAIGAAAPGDTVDFSCAGTITLTGAGGGPIVLDKDLTIDGGQAVTISGGGSVAVFEVASGATVTLTGLTIADGAYDAGSGGANGAGGVVNQGTLHIVDSTFGGNTGTSAGTPTVAGAIYNAVLASLDITGSTFSGNSASGSLSAGAVYSAGGQVTVTASTFSANFADQGGAIAAGGDGGIGTLSVINSTFSGNTVGWDVGTGSGGAIFSDDFAAVSVTNSTLTGNSASGATVENAEAGGIYVDPGNPAFVSLTNTVLAGNFAVGSWGYKAPANCGPLGVTDKGGNFSDDSTCGVTQASAAALALGPLANNGGPTQTVALQPGSVAIDAASCLQSTDQRGLPRPGAGGTTCDSGAYEAQGSTDNDLALTGVPTDIVVEATSASGATVTYTAPTAVDEPGDATPPTLSCTPQSPSTFPVGTTTVTCTATDTDDVVTSVSATFTVTVNPLWTLSAVSGSGTYGGTATLTATLLSGDTAFAGEPVAFSLDSGTSILTTTDGNGVATVSGVDLTGIDVGTYAGAVAAYSDRTGGSVTGTLTVNPADQTIAVTTAAPPSAADGSSFTVAATASSGLPVAYATSGPCTNSGATITVTGGGSCTITYSQAGNGNYNAATPVTETVDAVAVDTTPPADAPTVTGTAGGSGWYRSGVSVAWNWTDAGSGIDSSSCTQSNASTGEGTTVAVSSTCTDLAGNTASDTLTFKVDKTKPTIHDDGTGQAPTGNDGARDWYDHAVAVGFSAADGLSGPAGSCSSSWTVATSGEGTGVTASSGACADTAGNSTPGITSSAYNVDTTKPVVTVTGVSDGATYTLGSVPDAGCDTTDGLSGVRTPATLSLSGGPVGSFTATCSGAADNAGNTNSTSVTYTVTYAFSGFFAPVENPPVCNVARAGSAIPLVFSLGSDRGLSVIAAGYPTVGPGTCTDSTASSVDETSASGQSGLSYDPTTDQYTYVWKTDTAWRGEAKVLTIVLADGTTHTAQFAFTK